jgi:hypothetical protein
MTKPVFALPWEPKRLASEIQQRIRPPPSSTLGNLGVALLGNPNLSAPLVNALHGLRDAMLLQNLGHQDPNGLTCQDHQLFLKLGSEVEHELLSYPYRSSTGSQMGSGRSNVHATESLTRVAAISYLNLSIIVSPPSTGLGRSLTKHMKQAISSFTASGVAQMPPPYLDLLAWALFIAAHGSMGQIEWPWFVSRMADVITARGWKQWEEVAEIMTRHFYISYLHGAGWRVVWDEAMTHLAVAEVETE